MGIVQSDLFEAPWSGLLGQPGKPVSQQAPQGQGPAGPRVQQEIKVLLGTKVQQEMRDRMVKTVHPELEEI